MTGPWGPPKLIRIEDLFLIKLGGHQGYDYKLILKKPEWRHHYTISIGTPPRSELSNLHVYIHRAEETHPKQYTTLAKGSFNLEAFVRSIIPDALPQVQKVDLSSSDFANQEIIPFDAELLELFSKKEILLNRDMLYKFQPKPISEFKPGRFGIGMPYGGRNNPRMIIKADEVSFSIKFPALETFEGRLEKVMGIEFIEDVEEEDGDVEEDQDELEEDSEE